MASRKSRVYVLYTGGTLGMVPSDPSNPASPLVPASRAKLERYLPKGLEKELGIEYVVEGLRDLDGKPVEPIDSSDVTSEHWRYMAKAIADVYNGDKKGPYDGFVILHGTDTMAYTTSALSFMLANLAKPVVITGSQLPIFHPRTDAVSNFVNALYVAGSGSMGQPLISEVILVFAGVVLRGNRVRKMSSSALQGFETPNYPNLGSIGEHIRIASEYLREPADNDSAPFFARLDLERNVADVSLFPGVHPSHLESVLLSETLRGAILRTYGSGNAPSTPELLDVIDKAVKAGKVIVNVTQCPQGMVEAGLYEASSGLLERGVISGLDLTPEAALTKLMSLLANEPPADVAVQMQIDLRGEQSASLFDVRFGASQVRRSKGSKPVDAPNVSRRKSSVTIAATASGRFRPALLQEATIRLRGLRASGVAQGQKVAFKVFLNHPNADRSTPATDPRHVGSFEFENGKDARAMADIKDVAKRAIEDGRAIQVTLVPTTSGVESIDFDAVFVALLCR